MAAIAISPAETPVTLNVVPVVPIGTTVPAAHAETFKLADSISEPDWSDKLSQQICGLWSSYRKNRMALGSALLTQKELLKADRYGLWSVFLNHAGIPRSSAERFIAGFLKYLTIPAEIRELAKTQGIDIGKPSVLKAIQAEDLSFDLAACSKEERDEFVASLKKAPKRRKAAKEEPISSPTDGANEKLAQLKSCISDYLASFNEPAERISAANDLCDWIDIEFVLDSDTNEAT